MTSFLGVGIRVSGKYTSKMSHYATPHLCACTGTIPNHGHAPNMASTWCLIYSALCTNGPDFVNLTPISGTVPHGLASSRELLAWVNVNTRVSGTLPMAETVQPRLKFCVYQRTRACTQYYEARYGEMKYTGSKLPSFGRERTPNLEILSI